MMEGSTNVLALFSNVLIQTAIKEGRWHEIRLTNSFGDDAPIEFEISGCRIDFID